MTRMGPALFALIGLLSSIGSAHAQTKQELVAKVLQLQRPGIEGTARAMVEQPAAQAAQQARVLIQRHVPADRREAVANDMQADLRQYVEEMTPGMRERANRLAPATMGVLLEERLNEAELREVITILESPAFRKYQSMFGEMQRSLVEKLTVEAKPVLEPRLRTLSQTLQQRLAPYVPSASAPRPGPAAAPKTN